MQIVSISPSTIQPIGAPGQSIGKTPVPPPDAPQDPFAGMTLLTAEGQQPRSKSAIEITRNQRPLGRQARPHLR